MKIWATEKLERVLNGLLDYPIARTTASVALHRNQNNHALHGNTQSNVNLSHLLRNERLHGPTDRDPNVVSKDLHYWKGPYIYVRDMFDVNRPIILREYPKVQRREDGTWPQFRSVSGGKCPFIEEHVHQRRENERINYIQKGETDDSKAKAKAKAEPKASKKESQTAVAKTSGEQRQKQVVREYAVPKLRSPAKNRAAASKNKRIIAEVNSTNNRTTVSRSTAIEVTSTIPTKRRPENTIAFTATNEIASQTARRCNVEPAASGLQPSNVTSAIRSQVISSHLDQPGQRAGTSKELHALHRKVAGNVLSGNPTSRALDIAKRSTELQVRNPDVDIRIARKRDIEGREKVKPVDPPVGQRVQRGREVEPPKKKQKSEPKPGYCENCREKFEDFDEVFNPFLFLG
jgi:regulatory subunit for Cdc7p protein kinase